ncbi:hypothetical protein [Gracilimonas tropica]|uniref:hypothetical protein n=1 Tax=Gracilimonas tropica TaxID=454600 RepID=UPI00036033E2|nr:hypothetical protein [Gracilimonas tropica]
MKHIENKIEKIGSAFLIIIVFWVISSCGDLATNEMESKLATTTSQVDGNPIINISAKDFYEHDFTEAYRDKIVARYGSHLLKELTEMVRRIDTI